ncbi:unnamed protein product [Calypogeia fissa]
MLPLSSPPQMLQGSFFRSSPSRFSFSLCTSVSRRITWSQLAPWACSAPPQSVNPSSSSSSSSGTDFAPPSLPPLPSERFRQVDSHFRDGSPRQERYRSVGSRSEPSLPSIPGKFSKYSKPISKLHTERAQKRVERKDKKAFRKPMGDIAAKPDRNVVEPSSSSSSSAAAAPPVDDAAVINPARKDSSSGPLYPEQLPDWMQQGYQFSYSEAPKVPIIGFRETPWSPFGPADMLQRPWTGLAPLKPQKKKVPVFDSFNPPPPGKKGVKYVQRPGPFPPGQGPKPGKTREEVLGEPLTPLEITELVNAVNKGSKQLNLGRDGLTHNMLDVIHSHWKRSVVCKIKCKGVPTMDMDHLARVIEDKTGGVIIHRTGGVIFLFRGRNYNYKDRPQIPIMLWKPPDPIYPKLIQPIPEGLTAEEAKRLRGVGRKVAPLCRLSKNGVYLNLVAEVKAQLGIDEVVRVDCTGLNPTDYKKIGAKLKELVPCTLLSFEKEQVIVTRKKPTLVKNVQQTQDGEQAVGVSTDRSDSPGADDGQQTQECEQAIESSMDEDKLTDGMEESVPQVDSDEQKLGLAEDIVSAEPLPSIIAFENENLEDVVCTTDGDPQHESILADGNLEDSGLDVDEDRISAAADTDVITETSMSTNSRATEDVTSVIQEPSVLYLNSEEAVSVTDEGTAGSSMDSVDDFEALWQQAIEEGKALQLDSQIADPELVFEKASELSGIDEEAVREEEERLAKERLENERLREQEKKKVEAQVPTTAPFDVPPMGGLGVDELARLLAP